MIRRPLRPLAHILEARKKGENPDVIERENLRLRHEQMREVDRQRTEYRLVMLSIMFLGAFVVIGARMAHMAGAQPLETGARDFGAGISGARADIVDRNGRVMATNLATHSLYAHPHQMIDPEGAARALVRIFPELDEARLLRSFTGKRKFVWVRKTLSPEQRQLVHDIGEPGLLFGPRETRLYPGGAVAAHVLGGAGYRKEDVSVAEIVGVAGIEKKLDERLRDPALVDQPLELSLDMTVQSVVEEVLHGGMTMLNAKGAAAIMMDVRNGEIIALASLPDFDPNRRPRPAVSGDPGDSPLFNRAVQGVYELGSVFKPLTVAQSLDLKLVNPDTKIDTKGPLRWGRHRIRDFHYMGKSLSVRDIVVQSSNIGTARLAMMIGVVRHKEFLKSLGFMEIVPVELVEARAGAPLLPPRWSELSTMTISYGHGMNVSPLHLARAYAALANGGRLVVPTLLKQPDGVAVEPGAQVMSDRATAQVRAMLRAVVSEQKGTAKFARIPGYPVGGKTGTADKQKSTGGYYKDRVIATFASVFPMDAPRYVLVVTLDEPVETLGKKPRRSAGWTAVPVAGEIIKRTAPLLGVRPRVEFPAQQRIGLLHN